MMSRADINNSNNFKTFAKDFGNEMQCDEYTYKKFLEPSIEICKWNWSEQRNRVRNSLGIPFDFEIGLIENKSLPNAICGFDGQKHIIMMHHTVPIFLIEFFNRILCNNEVLNEIGNPDTKPTRTKFESPPGFAIYSGEVKISTLDDLVYNFAPQCPVRYKIAMTLYHYAMAIIWEHEIAHAINGHVHYARIELNINAISENQNTLNISQRQKIYSYLESMADKGASFNITTGYLLRKMNTPFSIVSNDFETTFDLKLRVLAGSLLNLFWMLCDVVRTSGEFNSINTWSDHPSSVARAMEFILTPLAANKDLDDIEVKYLIANAVESASTELLKMSNHWGIFRPFRWLTKSEMVSTIFTPYMLESNQILEIQKKLEPFRYNIRF